MRFMILRKADKKTEAGVMPSQELLAAMGKYMEEMVNAGVLLGGDGLRPSSQGMRVRFAGGKPVVTDGPFAETKELLAGYCIIQVKSREEALDWVSGWPALDDDGTLELELRPYAEADDFGPEFTPEMREHEDRMRLVAEQNAKK